MALTSHNVFAETTASMVKSTEQIRLKREIGLFSAVNLIFSVMIGSGIFVSPSPALRYSGSVGMSIVVWTVCGIVSLLGALSFAELGLVVNRSGAEYAYFTEAFTPLHKFWGGIPAFICQWVFIVMLRPAEVAIIVLTFSEYFSQPILYALGINCHLENAKKCIALLTLATITYINITSVKLYVKVQNVLSSFKILACLIVIFGGVYELAKGNTENLSKGFEGTHYTAKNIALAFYSGLWAYDGWSSVTVVCEEIKKPEVNILRSIIIAVPLVTAFYVFMNVAYMTVLPIPELISAKAVAVVFGEKVLGVASFLIPLGVALSTFGCALSVQFGVTRLCYVSGQEGHMVQCLSFINVRRLTPAPAVAFQGTICFIFILTGNIVQLIEFASFLIWFFYGLAMVALLVLRRTKKDVHRPWKVPIWIPIFQIMVSIFLSVVPIATDPTPKYLFAIGFILLGFLVYYQFVYRRVTLPFMGKITYLVQMLFEAVPPQRRKK